MTKTVGIYVFDDIEVLDLGGPFEVFSVANRLAIRTQGKAIFDVITISQGSSKIVARGGFQFCPSHCFSDAPPIDILIIPGGVVDQECDRPDAIDWIRRAEKTALVTASVCTGAFLLAKAGLLTGHKVTTHWEDIDALERQYPDLTAVRNQRWVDEGNIVTSGGISAGLDMSLHLLHRLEGRDLADAVARQMEYEWQNR